MSYNNNEGSRYQVPSDEIDLREVLAFIGRFFASMGRGILNVILSIRKATFRFAILILSFLLLGALAGFFLFQTNKEYYRIQMVIDSQYFTYELLESIVNNFNEQAGIGARPVLAKELNLTVEQAAGLRGMSVSPLLPLEEKVNLMAYLRKIREAGNLFEEEQLDSIQSRLLLNASQYVITAEVYDHSIIEELQAGVVLYLSSKDYVANRSRVERENLLMLKRSIEADEEKLAILKSELAGNYNKLSESARAGSNNLYLGLDADAGPKNVFDQSLALYAQKAKINKALLLSKEVEVVSDFTPVEEPASLSLLENIILFSLIGMGIAYIIILIISINRSLNKYEQKRDKASVSYS